MITIYCENKMPDKEDYFRLFESTGWNQEYKLGADELMQSLKSSWYIVSAYDQGNLVGFGRIISDGILHAVITEMMVLPAYQGQGIGRELLQMLTDKCRENRIRDIQLFSARGKTGFYEKFGFKPRPEESPGMEIKWNPNPSRR